MKNFAMINFHLYNYYYKFKLLFIFHRITDYQFVNLILVMHIIITVIINYNNISPDLLMTIVLHNEIIYGCLIPVIFVRGQF